VDGFRGRECTVGDSLFLSLWLCASANTFRTRLQSSQPSRRGTRKNSALAKPHVLQWSGWRRSAQRPKLVPRRKRPQRQRKLLGQKRVSGAQVRAAVFADAAQRRALPARHRILPAHPFPQSPPRRPRPRVSPRARRAPLVLPAGRPAGSRGTAMSRVVGMGRPAGGLSGSSIILFWPTVVLYICIIVLYMS
jgi:hypothetical protein